MMKCPYKSPSTTSSSTKMTKVRPAARLMQAGAQCAELGAAYGNCVLATYNNMNKDTCKKEFDAFRSCVSANMKRK